MTKISQGTSYISSMLPLTARFCAIRTHSGMNDLSVVRIKGRDATINYKIVIIGNIYWGNSFALSGENSLFLNFFYIQRKFGTFLSNI